MEEEPIGEIGVEDGGGGDVVPCSRSQEGTGQGSPILSAEKTRGTLARTGSSRELGRSQMRKKNLKESIQII